jgi:ubiquinone/menaquinone biosynthesis C-methylase UbiE
MTNVLSHNERAAATWGSGGRDYDRISESVSDALAHLVNRIAPPQPGERFLDVATGTGLTARLLTSRGAKVTGVDFGAGVIEAAKALAPDIDFHVADAEALPFEDASSMRSHPPLASCLSPDRKLRRARWPVFASGAGA